MNEEVKKLIFLLLEYGNPSPMSILALGLDFGYEKRAIQFTVQIGLDQGLWHLDPKFHLAKGPLYK